MTGTFVEWLEAFGTGVSAVAAIAASWLAAQANKQAKQSAEDTAKLVEEGQKYQREYEESIKQHNAQILAIEQRQEERLAEYEAKRQALAEEERQTDILRERRELAGSLQVWWVQPLDLPINTWGIIIQNQGLTPQFFRDVRIEICYEQHGISPIPQTLTRDIDFLPPGTHFHPVYECTPGLEDNHWKKLINVNDLTHFQPITHSKNYRVLSFAFTDAVNQRWRWTPEQGLSVKQERSSSKENG